MSLKKVNPEQPKNFEFSEKFKTVAEEILKKYPKKNKKSAVMPFLYIAQKQNDNWIPLAAIKYISKYLSMPEFGASFHLAGVLLKTRSFGSNASAILNLAFPQKYD